MRRLWRFLRKLTRIPPVGAVDLGSLDCTSPVSRNWGFDRGTPVDRVYIEAFLESHRRDVKGRVLEVANNEYTNRFGGDAVEISDILENEGIPENDRATLVLDLENVDAAPKDCYDCIICTQTLHLIYDHRAALQSLYTMLKPGGVLLLTAPAITQISRWDADRHGDNWRYTSMSLQRLCSETFDVGSVRVQSYGNVYAAVAFLHGLAREDLDVRKLDVFDADYEMLLGVRAVKAG